MSSEPAVPPTPSAPKKFPLGRVILIAIAAVIVCFGCIQLVPINRTNPPVVQEPDWDSQQTRALAQRACFDCHSNETTWPWYSTVAPVSWYVYFDVVRARRELNFSDWQTGSSGTRQADRITRNISSGEMPPGNYLMLHPDARLSAAERQQLIDGIKATLRQ